MSEAATRLAAESVVHGAVLLVDDDVEMLAGLSRLLQHQGVTVYQASTGSAAARSALAHRPEVVVLDNRLGNSGEMTGIDVIEALHAQSFYPTWILYSGFMEIDVAVEAGRHHPFRVVSLPAPELDTTVIEALRATQRGEAGGWPLLPVRPSSTSPPTSAAVGADWILKACDSEGDLRNFAEWAHVTGVSGRRMRDLYKQMNLDPQHVKWFMRMFRALARARGYLEDAVAELIVGDPRTLKHVSDDAGLNVRPAVRVPLEQFLRTQKFVPYEHSLMTALRSLIATRSLPTIFKP